MSKAESSLSSSSQLLVNKPKKVNLDMFWSGIVLIIVGTALSCLVAAAEILWFKYRGRVSYGNHCGNLLIPVNLYTNISSTNLLHLFCNTILIVKASFLTTASWNKDIKFHAIMVTTVIFITSTKISLSDIFHCFYNDP